MDKSYRVVLAEDHTILREGLRAIFTSQCDIEVVREAADGFEAIRSAKACDPDLVLMDLSMPRMNGMQAIREIKRCCPNTKVIVLTVHKTDEYVFEALQAGAEGYVLKDATSAELTLGVRTVLDGHCYLSPQISSQVIEGYLGKKDEPSYRSAYDDLTRREREVLKLIAEGHRNREIAEVLCISEKTVEKHRSNLMRKLALKNVQALTTFAIEKGLVTA